MVNSALFSKKTDEWYTPDDFFHNLDRQFHFTVDVASTDDNCKCLKHYTIENSGLLASWEGERVWCNPPYSNVSEWLKKG